MINIKIGTTLYKNKNVSLHDKCPLVAMFHHKLVLRKCNTSIQDISIGVFLSPVFTVYVFLCYCDYFVFNSARERIVGWYHTGPKLHQNDVAVNELIRRYCPNSVSCNKIIQTVGQILLDTQIFSYFFLHIFFPVGGRAGGF